MTKRIHVRRTDHGRSDWTAHYAYDRGPRGRAAHHKYNVSPKGRRRNRDYARARRAAIRLGWLPAPQPRASH